MIKVNGYSADELAAFRNYQRIAFGVLDSVAATLQPGMTEHDAARQMRKAFHEAGAHNYFHVPVALFGERTTYPGDFGEFEALPTNRALNNKDVVILDAAPVFCGYTVDTSLAVNFSGRAGFDELDRYLPELRQVILDQVVEGISFQKIAWSVDDRIREFGAENCHRKHIGAVLGHRVTKAASLRFAGWSIKGLAVKQVAWFLARSRLARGRFRRHTPNWNHTSSSDVSVPHGLWAVEPHIARGDVGVKFEEILVIDEAGARWLDDDLPHHRRWQV